jgi:3-oxoacyl-[acyl-carrier protein] reductase/2-deoxy-D-gluconate 3-dehydrogenase
MAGILEGKVALVTGVSGDGQVGQAVARTMAEHGALLGIAARSQDKVTARADELKATGVRVLPLVADLTDEAQVRQLVENMMADYGKIDILVNNAAYSTVTVLASYDPDDPDCFKPYKGNHPLE